ncbi:MAG: hypothetical protein OET90_09855 [Desulfuromonadales bacterium]|nr:hypothetical protein [Desulfuromonadales bacterium]
MQRSTVSLSSDFEAFPHFALLRQHCQGKGGYLVGGAVRDALLGHKLTDLDLIFPQDPTPLAKAFARKIGGHWFWLDSSRQQSRVVISRQTDALHFDFLPFRASTLQADLLDRDFSINAMALALDGDLTTGSLHDPCDGRTDLQQQRLAMVSERSFADDPLRIIKGIRHATILDLEVDDATSNAMRQHAPALKTTAPERVRQEIWRILADDRVGRGLELLRNCGVGRVLFGEPYERADLDQIASRVSRWRQQWRWLQSQHNVVADWLNPELEQGLNVETLLIFTYALALLDPALPLVLAQSWRLSRKSSRAIKSLLALDAAALEEFLAIAPTDRACSWWANRKGLEPTLLIPALAVIAAQSGAATLEPLADWAPLLADAEVAPKSLVDGHWMRSELGLSGEEIAESMQRLADAEIRGEVGDVEQAKAFLLGRCSRSV